MSKVIFYVVPFMVVFGMVTLWASGTFHIPSANQWIGMFSELESITEFKALASNMSAIFNNVSTSFSSISDWNSFWNAIGSFFQAWGALFKCAILIFKVPIDLFIWLAQTIFSPALD